MALYLPKKSPIGIPLSYHRITALTMFTNDSVLVEVTSYLNESERLREKVYLLTREKREEIDEPIYCDAARYIAPYTDGMTCTEAYDYLKTLPEFAGATDILEDDDADL